MSRIPLFGTDGIRAHVASPIMRPDSFTRIGQVLAAGVQRGLYGSARKNCVVIGKDTRKSGAYLEQALGAGITSLGVDVELLGVLPTAAVAHFTKEHHASLGIMISASHNPYCDNGLKIFDANGYKIAEAQEHSIEDDIARFAEQPPTIALEPGHVLHCLDARHRYATRLLASLNGSTDCTGLRIVIDNAHGAASGLAHEIFEALFATVISIAEFAEGKDINSNCGSEAPEHIRNAVVQHQADIGIAFDGDADRVILVDEHGQLIEGDAMLAALAIALKSRGQLAHNTCVATVMSSVALDNALSPHGITVVRTQVGDKFVARMMQENGFCFGGENSGHLIIFPHATTGDGILSALHFVSLMRAESCSASQLVSNFIPTPRLLKNIVVDEKIPLERLPLTQAAIAKANLDLHNVGRVMVRYSGTENKARILVEAPTNKDCERIACEIAEAFVAEIARSRVPQ